MSNVPERAQKNEHQYAKILLFSLVAEEDWEEDIGAWRHRATPVYRKPQDEWEVAGDHSQRWIYFLPMTVGDGDSIPDSFPFPEWIPCFWDSQAGKWIVLQSGNGSAMLVWTSISGIPAAVLTSTTVTLGSASCYMTTRSGAVVTKDMSQSVTVYNTVTQAIGADSPIQVKLLSDGIWVVDVEICGVSGGDGPDPNPPMALGFDDEDDDFFLRV